MRRRVPDSPKEHSRRRFIFSRQWFAAGILLFFAGCANQTPILYPSSHVEASAPQSSSALRVLLTPVDTSGITSQAKSQYGLDVSAYFTAFELQLINQSNQQVDFESGEIYLVYPDGKEQRALTEEESVDYYRYGDLGPDGAVVLISKPLSMLRSDIEQIRRLRIQSAAMPPGESNRGMVLFKKVGQGQCSNVRVRLKGITFTEAAGSKDVDVAFTCENR